MSAAADRFLAKVGHWSVQRWTQPATNGGPAASRAVVAFELVQRLADLAADAEARRHRAVPRLDNDLALVDQVRVMVLDLLGAPPKDDLLTEAATAITAATRAL